MTAENTDLMENMKIYCWIDFTLAHKLVFVLIVSQWLYWNLDNEPNDWLEENKIK